MTFWQASGALGSCLIREVANDEDDEEEGSDYMDSDDSESESSDDEEGPQIDRSKGSDKRKAGYGHRHSDCFFCVLTLRIPG